MPPRTVVVAAADLPGYIAGLPRLLTGDLYVTVSAGTTQTAVTISGFYGVGKLTITAQTGAEVNFSRINAYYNNAMIVFNGLKFQGESDALLTVYQSDLRLMDCAFLGVDSKGGGVSAYAMALIELDKCTFEGLSTAIVAGETSIISAINCAAAENYIGAHVWHGGIVMLAGTTSELLGGATSTKAGGLIVKGDGTLL